MRGAVGCLDGLLVGTLDEAKAAAGLFFEPVGDEAHAEALLHLEIAQVGGCEIGSRRIRKVVAIHVKAASQSKLYSATARTDSAALPRRTGKPRACTSGLGSPAVSLFSYTLRVHEKLYKATDGRIGHRLLGVPTLLLRTTGRRSGVPPLVFILLPAADARWRRRPPRGRLGSCARSQCRPAAPGADRGQGSCGKHHHELEADRDRHTQNSEGTVPSAASADASTVKAAT